MVFKNELYPIHFYGRVRGKCDGRLQNWPGIVNERPKFLAMTNTYTFIHTHTHTHTCIHTRTHAHTYKSTYTNVQTYTCAYINTYKHACKHIHIHTHTQTHTHTHTHTNQMSLSLTYSGASLIPAPCAMWTPQSYKCVLPILATYTFNQ